MVASSCDGNRNGQKSETDTANGSLKLGGMVTSVPLSLSHCNTDVLSLNSLPDFHTLLFFLHTTFLPCFHSSFGIFGIIHLHQSFFTSFSSSLPFTLLLFCIHNYFIILCFPFSVTSLFFAFFFAHPCFFKTSFPSTPSCVVPSFLFFYPSSPSVH